MLVDVLHSSVELGISRIPWCSAWNMIHQAYMLIRSRVPLR